MEVGSLLQWFWKARTSSGFLDDPEWRAAHADGKTALHFRGRLQSSKTEVLEFAGLPARLPGYTEPGSTSINRKA